MTHTVHFDNYVRAPTYTDVVGGGGYKRLETKERVVQPFVMPELYVPFLGARRLSILSSLGVMRLPKK
jgi:hypothetical protein